jgi:hypothetical protein
VDLAFTLGAAVAVVAAWRLLRPPHALYATALLLAPLFTGSLLSMPRFVLGIFPVFLVLARVTARPLAERAALVLGAGGLAVSSALYAQYYWVS